MNAQKEWGEMKILSSDIYHNRNQRAGTKIAHTWWRRGLPRGVQNYRPAHPAIYRWKGQSGKYEEWLCLIKTQDVFSISWKPQLRVSIFMKHRRLLAVPIVKGSKEYFDLADD